MVCSYYSSHKWNESRGEERVSIYEGDRSQLEGKLSHSISEKKILGLLYLLQSSSLILHLVYSCLHTCYKQCKFPRLREKSLVVLLSVPILKHKKIVYYEQHILWTTLCHRNSDCWDYTNAKHIGWPRFTKSLSSHTALFYLEILKKYCFSTSLYTHAP